MKLKLLFAFVVAVIFINVVFNSENTFAASGTCFFGAGAGGKVSSDGTCSVTGMGFYKTNDILPRPDPNANSISIPLSSVNDLNDFTWYIHDKFDNGNDQEKIGAAFIIQSNRGVNTWPSEADVADWVSRMEGPDMDYTSGVVTGIRNTSWYDNNKHNVFFGKYDADIQRDIISIWQKQNGTFVRVSQIERSCGNASLAEVISEPVNWSLAAFVSASVNDPYGPSTNVAEPGDTIYWRHRIQNSDNSTSITNKDISISWKNVSGFSDNGAVGNVLDENKNSVPPVSASAGLTIGEMLPANGNNPYYSGLDGGYKLTNADVGRDDLCRTTMATPGSSVPGAGSVEAAKACVKVEAPDQIIIQTPPPSGGSTPPSSGDSVCRPIKFTTRELIDVHTNGQVGITVYAKNDRPGSSSRVKVGHYSSPTEIGIDLTNRCTTGDTWTITEVSDSYIYSHSTYADCSSVTSGDPPSSTTVCGAEYDHDLSRVSTKATSVGPCFNYLLTTDLKLSHVYQVEAGNEVGITPKIDSDEAFPSYIYNSNTYDLAQTHSHNLKWELTKLIVPSSSNPDDTLIPAVAAGDSIQDPCHYIENTKAFVTNETCETFLPLPSKSTFTAGSGDYAESVLSGSSISNLSYQVEDLSPGSKVCFMFSIFGHSSEDNNSFDKSSYSGNVWVHSGINNTSSCVIVVKKPKVQIWGGDLWSGGSVISSPSAKKGGVFGTGTTFGSWIEYGIFAKYSINGVASGSAFAGGLVKDITSVNMCDYSTLSFANTDNHSSCSDGSSIGNYSNTRTIPDIFYSFPNSTGPDIPDDGSIIDVNGLL